MSLIFSYKLLRNHVGAYAGLTLCTFSLEASPIDPNNILASIKNTVCEFTPGGSPVQVIPFNYFDRAPSYYGGYPNGIVVDQYGIVDSVASASGGVAFLTRYAPDVNTFTRKTYPAWGTQNNSSYGSIAAYQNFVFANDEGSFLGQFGGILRFNVYDDTALRFAIGTDFIAVNIGLDRKLYALSTSHYAADKIYIFDPVTTQLINQIPIPASIISNDDILSIAVDDSGRIFLTGRATVYRLNQSGILEASKYTGFTTLNNIQVDENGRLIIGQSNRVLLGDASLQTDFTSFLVINDPNAFYRVFACLARPMPPPVGPVATPPPTPTPSPTPVPIHNIITTAARTNDVREFNPAGSLLRKISLRYNGGRYPGTEYLRDLAVDDNGIINVYAGTITPYLTRYSPSSDVFTLTGFPGWNTWNVTTWGGMAAYYHFVYATDVDSGNETDLNGIVRFDNSENSAARFAVGIDFHSLSVGLDGKLYGLYSRWGTDGYDSDINVYDPISMSLLGHIAIPPQILADDYIHGLAIDDKGRIFMGGRGGTVYRLDKTGVLEAAEATGFRDLVSLKIDETGRLVVGQLSGYVITGYSALASDFDFFVAVDDVGSPFSEVFVAFTPPLLPPPQMQLISAVSEKTHGSAGTFDIDLPQQGPLGIECRSPGTNNNDYVIVLTFTNPLVSFARPSASGGAQVYQAYTGPDPHHLYIQLVTVPNGQVVTVTLSDVHDDAGNILPAVPISMKILVGDTNGDGLVNSADIAQTKSQSGRSLGPSNFREDLNADGNLDSADIALVKSKSGTALLGELPRTRETR